MKRILLIDAFNLFIRSFTVVTKMNDHGDHYGGTFGFVRAIRGLIDEIHPDTVIVCWDGDNSGLRRKEVCKEYKATRNTRIWKRGRLRAYDFYSEDEEKNSFRFQYKLAMEFTKSLPVHQIRIPFVEADDVIAYLYKTVDDAKFVIYSSDKDYLQLLCDDVVTYNPYTRKIYNKYNFEEEHGFSHENYCLTKAVVGDKSDNLDGVYGVGEKTLLKLAPGLKRSIYSLDEFMEIIRYATMHRPDGYTDKQFAKYQAMIDYEEAIRMNYRLMKLDESCVSHTAKSDILLELDRKIRFNRKNIKMLIIKHALQMVVRNEEMWLSPFNYLNVPQGKV